MKWFGIGLVYPENTLVATPVGAPCGYCGEAIGPADRGCIIPHLGEDGASEKPFHFECHMRLVIGSLAQQQRRCSCYGGAEHEPPGMTLRQAAPGGIRLLDEDSWKLRRQNRLASHVQRRFRTWPGLRQSSRL